VEQLLDSAEMVAVGHYLYAGEAVGGSIEFRARYLVRGEHGRRERETYMGLLCGKSLRKKHAKVQRRSRIAARGGT